MVQFKFPCLLGNWHAMQIFKLKSRNKLNEKIEAQYTYYVLFFVIFDILLWPFLFKTL